MYPRVLDICKLVGKEDSIFYYGGLSAGLKTKLLNYYLLSLTALAIAKTFNIGLRAGLDSQNLLKVINASVRLLGSLDAYRAVAVEERFRGKDSKVIYKWMGGPDPDLSES